MTIEKHLKKSGIVIGAGLLGMAIGTEIGANYLEYIFNWHLQDYISEIQYCSRVVAASGVIASLINMCKYGVTEQPQQAAQPQQPQNPNPNPNP